ncbi:hypothetical protein GCM10009780_75640 [Actinomadura alba]
MSGFCGAAFADRDELLAATAARAVGELAAALADRVEPAAPPAERLAAAAKTYVRFTAEHASLFQVLYGSGLDKARYPELAVVARPIVDAFGNRHGKSRRALTSSPPPWQPPRTDSPPPTRRRVEERVGRYRHRRRHRRRAGGHRDDGTRRSLGDRGRALTRDRQQAKSAGDQVPVVLASRRYVRGSGPGRARPWHDRRLDSARQTVAPRWKPPSSR